MRKTALILITLCSLLVTACPNQEQEMTCTVEETETGALVVCPDGTEVEVANGTNGNDGTLIVSVVPVAEGSEECPAGGTQLLLDGNVISTDCNTDYEATTLEPGNAVCPAGGTAIFVDGELVHTDCNTNVEMVDVGPGEDCQFGGQAMVVDGNTVGFTCNSRYSDECDVFVGDVQIHDTAMLNAVRGCRVIEGLLSVQMEEVGDAFLALEEVDFLQVSGNNMESFSDVFPSLTSVPVGVYLSNMDNLSDITGLAAVDTPLIVITAVTSLDACSVEGDLGELSVVQFPELPEEGVFFAEQNGQYLTCEQ